MPLSFWSSGIFTQFLLFRLVEGAVQRVPREDGTFDAGGEVGDIFQRRRVLKLFKRRVVGDFPLDHAEEKLYQALRLGDGLSFDEIDHQRGRGLRNGAADAGKRGRGDDAVAHLELQRDLVTAAGVAPLEDGGGMRQMAAMGGVSALLRDEFRVNLFKTQGA